MHDFNPKYFTLFYALYLLELHHIVTKCLVAFTKFCYFI